MFIISFLKKNLDLRGQRNAAANILTAVRKKQYTNDPEIWIKKHLNHSDWQIKNIAVKLVGECHLEQYAETVADCLDVGKNVGFIRRNAITSLRQLGLVNPTVKQAVIAALDDPYWEVRTEAGLWISELSEPCDVLTDQLIDRIYSRPLTDISAYPIFWPKRIYREKNFEVRAALILALGATLTSKNQLKAVTLPLHEELWKIRDSALRAYINAAARLGLAQNKIAEQLSGFDLTCTEFIPNFPIRTRFNELSDNHTNNSEKPGETSCSTN